jgi:N-acetylmuramoyl-L-alanine amidase
MISRPIDYIFIHCTASTPGTTVKNILDYWKNVKGWNNPGYHFLITPEGRAVRIAEDSQVTNGVRGYNCSSIHISWIGGNIGTATAPVWSNNITANQYRQLIALTKYYNHLFPNAKVLGHREVNKGKLCPLLDVTEVLEAEGIPNKITI